MPSPTARSFRPVAGSCEWRTDLHSMVQTTHTQSKARSANNMSLDLERSRFVQSARHWTEMRSQQP